MDPILFLGGPLQDVFRLYYTLTVLFFFLRQKPEKKSIKGIKDLTKKEISNINVSSLLRVSRAQP